MCGDEKPSYTVKNWFNQFNRGRHSLEDDDREGRLKAGVVTENIDAVREFTMAKCPILGHFFHHHTFDSA